MKESRDWTEKVEETKDSGKEDRPVEDTKKESKEEAEEESVKESVKESIDWVLWE